MSIRLLNNLERRIALLNSASADSIGFIGSPSHRCACAASHCRSAAFCFPAQALQSCYSALQWYPAGLRSFPSLHLAAPARRCTGFQDLPFLLLSQPAVLYFPAARLPFL